MREGEVWAWATDRLAAEDEARRAYLERAIAERGEREEPAQRTPASKRTVKPLPVPGDRFCQWTIVAYLGRRKLAGRAGSPIFRCRCTCGREANVALWSLRQRSSTRCRTCADVIRNAGRDAARASA